MLETLNISSVKFFTPNGESFPYGCGSPFFKEYILIKGYLKNRINKYLAHKGKLNQEQTKHLVSVLDKLSLASLIPIFADYYKGSATAFDWISVIIILILIVIPTQLFCLRLLKAFEDKEAA